MQSLNLLHVMNGASEREFFFITKFWFICINLWFSGKITYRFILILEVKPGGDFNWEENLE